MKFTTTIICAAALIVSSCSSGGDGPGAFGDSSGDGDSQSSTSGIDVCALLTEAELTTVLGNAPAPSPSEPAGPFTGCSWGTGRVLVSIAPATSLILAPGQEDECPDAGVGDVSLSCPGKVMFLTNGIHASVTTIEAVDESQLIALADIVLPKLQG